MTEDLTRATMSGAQDDSSDMATRRTYKPEDQARRFAASEEALRDAGGKSTRIRFSPEGVEAMEQIMAAKEMNQTEAVHYALTETAERIKARKR
jgi:hypothetical protein